MFLEHLSVITRLCPFVALKAWRRNLNDDTTVFTQTPGSATIAHTLQAARFGRPG